MVHTIDGDERRRVLTEAVWRLLERDGVAAASVRGVAAQAGLSAGSVRHFFTSQSELQLFALTALADRVADRIRRAAEEPDVRRRVVAMVTELVPLRDETERELRVWWEFVQMSRHDSALRAVIAAQSEQIRVFLHHIVDGLAELGLTTKDEEDDEDTEVAVDRLSALLDGLTVELLLLGGPVDRARAEHVLTATLLGRSTPVTRVPDDA